MRLYSRMTACELHIMEGERKLVEHTLGRLARQFRSHHASCRAKQNVLRAEQPAGAVSSPHKQATAPLG